MYFVAYCIVLLSSTYEKKDGSGKQNTTDIIVNQIEFMDPKEKAQQPQDNFFDDDVFTPVDDSDSELPF